MRRAIAGKSPSEIKAMDKDQLNLPTSQQDLVDALGKVSPSVSPVRWLTLAANETESLANLPLS